MIECFFKVVGIDETLTGGEVLMTSGMGGAWQVPFGQSSDKSRIEGTGYHSREEVLIGVRRAPNKLEIVC
jgi:hypothetical protein